MGKLALWGGVAGAGKGMQENADAQRKIDFAALEEAKDMRLREFDAGQATARQEAGFKHEDTSQAASFGQQEKLQAGEQTFQGGQTDKELGARAKEGAANRQNAKDVANINADSRRAAAAAKQGANGNKWQKTMLPGVFNLNDNSTSPAQVAVTAPDGATYIQSGDKFVAQGSPTPTRTANAKQISELLKTPTRAAEFVRYFGYIPMEFVGAMHTAATSGNDTPAQDDSDTDN